MLSETAEHAFSLLVYWMMTMDAAARIWILDDCKKKGEVYNKEFMTDRTLTDLRCLPVPAVWPRPPIAASRAALPRLSLAYATDAGSRAKLHFGGFACGAVAVAVPAARPIVWVFLIFVVAEVYAIFALFRPHMHFTPMLVLVASTFLGRGSRFRPLVLLAVCAQSYASTGAWRALQIVASEGFDGGLRFRTYGDACALFLDTFRAGCPASAANARLARLDRETLGRAYAAVTICVEGLLLGVVVCIEALALAEPRARPAATAARYGAAAVVAGFHGVNFAALGVWFGTQSATVCGVLCLFDAPAASEAMPLAHGAAALGVAALYAAAASRIDRFPWNGIVLFPYSAPQARFLFANWRFRRAPATLRLLVLNGPLAAALDAGSLSLSEKELSALDYARTVTGAMNPDMPPCILPEDPARAFLNDAYAFARERGLLPTDDGDDGWGQHCRGGYPGVADLVLSTPRLRDGARAVARAFRASRPFFDVVTETDDLDLVLAVVATGVDGAGRYRVERAVGAGREVG